MSKTFKITVLGCTAATPTSLFHTTAQWLQFQNYHFLLDCAEGTQMQMRRMKLPMMKIDNIFISHLHGDHYLGLPGLLFTYHLLGREKTLNIYSPPGLKEIIEVQFKIANVHTRFKTVFHDITKGEQLLFENKFLTVDSIEMKHSIDCYGFLFKEKELERNIKKESIKKYGISIDKMQDIKHGADFIDSNGKIIPNNTITKSPPPPRSYAFCSDTLYTETFIKQISNVDLLYHEATFLEDKADIAKEKTHTTAMEAARIAKKAKAGKLLIGHYSARYDDIKDFQKEAQTIFKNTVVAEEGMVMEIESKN
ncbi:MAG: ribonuclease Z [Bacteroidetes bacterium]|nr:ribonuclease Z [Bacteroidota bacterium]